MKMKNEQSKMENEFFFYKFLFTCSIIFQ